MQTPQYARYSHHGCQQSRGPEVFYGYCHETNRMRMMDYPDYVSNMQTGMSNLINNPSSSMQRLLYALASMMQAPGGTGTTTPTVPMPYGQHHHRHHDKHGCCCGCHEKDCVCWCCIRCADVIEYTRCSETRVIPISFDNDTRRERNVTLQLGNFASESGQDLGWQASVAPSTFTLPPCGETTVLLTVNVDCSKWGTQTPAGTPIREGRAPGTSIDGCKVAYATLRADGCTVRPIVIAVAVLPEFCGAHRAGCGCGCCN